MAWCRDQAYAMTTSDLKGFRTQPDGVITLEPGWHKARAFVWLLGIRQQVLNNHNLQADAHLKTFLNEAMQLIRADIAALSCGVSMGSVAITVDTAGAMG